MAEVEILPSSESIDDGDSMTIKFSLGKFRKLKSYNWFDWTFIAVVGVTLCALIGVTVGGIVYFDENFVNISTVDVNGSLAIASCNRFRCTSHFIYGISILANIALAIFFSFNGVLKERPLDIIGYIIALVIITLYTIAIFGHKNLEQRVAIRIVSLLVVLLVVPVNAIVGFAYWWKRMPIIGHLLASKSTLIRAYNFRSAFFVLQLLAIEVMINVFLMAFFSWSSDGGFISTGEKAVLIILLVFLVPVAIIRGLAVSWEKRFLAIAWCFMMSPYIVYFLYKIIAVSVLWSNFSFEYTVYIPAAVPTTFILIGATLIVACLTGVGIYVSMVVLMIISLSHFGKGLKENVRPLCHSCIGGE